MGGWGSEVIMTLFILFLFYFDAFVKIQEVMEQARGNAQQPSAFQVKNPRDSD